MPRGQNCSVENCDKKTKYGEICENHRYRMKKFNSYDLPSKDKTCIAPNCDRIRDSDQGSAKCVMHRIRWSRYKSFDLPEKEKLPEGIFYNCAVHGELDESQSYKNPKDGYYSCKECRLINRRNFFIQNPDFNQNDYKKNYYVGKNKLKFKIEDYLKIHTIQNGCCAICKKPETDISNSHRLKRNGNNIQKVKRLAIDHCHTSDKIRGLLCKMCNYGLGNFKDSIELLQAAIDYLKSYS